MNVDVIKQFSVCLKVLQLSTPASSASSSSYSKLLPFTRHENKNYFPIFLSCHPPFLFCKRQLPRMENEEEKSCCFTTTSSKDCVLFCECCFWHTFFYICMSIFSFSSHIPLSKFILRLHKTFFLYFA